MKCEHINKENGGLFFLTDFNEPSYKPLFSDSALYKIILSTKKDSTIYVNNKVKVLNKNELFFCKPLCNVEVIDNNGGLLAIAFNKDFYNIQNQNDEVLFYWFWYFGINHPLSVFASGQEVYPFSLIFNNFFKEFENKNGIRENWIRKKIRLILISASQRLEFKGESSILKMDQLVAIKKFSQLIEDYFSKTNDIKSPTNNNYFSQFKTVLANIFHKTKSIPFSTDSQLQTKSILHKN